MEGHLGCLRPKHWHQVWWAITRLHPSFQNSRRTRSPTRCRVSASPLSQNQALTRPSCFCLSPVAMYLGFTLVIREFEICPPFLTRLSLLPTSSCKVRNVSASQSVVSPCCSNILPTLALAVLPPPTPMPLHGRNRCHIASLMQHFKWSA